MAIFSGVTKHDFYPSRTSINVWWGFFWRTLLFGAVVLSFSTEIFQYIKLVWAREDFASIAQYLVWTQQNPAEVFLINQLGNAVFGLFPGMVLAWWMMLSGPVYRTYTLRHLRPSCKKANRGETVVAHGFCGAVRLAWSSFWRLAVNLLPFYALLYALQAYQVHLAMTTMEELPYINTLVSMLLLPMLYLYPLTLHHMLNRKHGKWSVEARKHSQKELLAAFLPSEK